MSEEEEKPTEAATAEGEAEAEAAHEEVAAKEEESTATFEPVVRLEEVQVETGEESEEAVYSQRAKLFVFAETLLDVGTGNKQWKERGIGNIRILRHREHQRCRVLMRQEKTMKLLINHLLLPGLVLVPHVNNDRAWVWRAEDFSDGEIKLTDFCIRFADSDIANTFKEAFAKYQEEMKKLEEGADKPGADGGAAGDEAAEALKNLSTKEGEDAKES